MGQRTVKVVKKETECPVSVTQTSAGYRCQRNVAVAFAIIGEVAFNKETIVKSHDHHNADMGTEALQGKDELQCCT